MQALIQHIRFFLTPGLAFWLAHLCGYVVYVAAIKLFDLHFGEAPFSLQYRASELVQLTLAGLAFRYCYWQFKLHHRSLLALVPWLVVLSLLLAIADVISERPDTVFSAWETIWQHGHWQHEDVRLTVAEWANAFYPLFGWLLLYTAVTAERNPAQGSARIAFSPSNANTRIAFLSLSLSLIMFTLMFALCWANMITLGTVVGSVFYVVIATLMAYSLTLMGMGPTLGGSHLLARLPLVMAMLPALALAGLTAHFIFISIITNLLQPDLFRDAQEAARQTQELAASTPPPVPKYPGSNYMGSLQQHLQQQAVLALLVVSACFLSRRQSLVDPTYFEPQHLFSTRQLSFWLYNLCGWSVAAFYFSIVQVWNIAELDPRLNIFVALSTVFSGMLFSPYMRQLLKNYSILDANPIVFVLKVLMICIAIGLASACTLTLLTRLYVFNFLQGDNYQAFMEFYSQEFMFFGFWAFYIVCFFLWGMFYLISTTYRNKTEADIQALKMEAELKQAQLNTLAGQLDPHFIFNSINNIRALVREDADKARQALITLSDILRSSVYKKSKSKIPLSEELEIISNYVELAQIQHEERLQYRESIDTNLMPALLPPMVLQILVENAIKHGISRLPDGGTLLLEVQTQDNRLICRVSNTGTLRQDNSSDGFGLGLQNIRERVRLLYGAQGNFSLNETQDDAFAGAACVVAELSIPLEFPDAASAGNTAITQNIGTL